MPAPRLIIRVEQIVCRELLTSGHLKPGAYQPARPCVGSGREGTLCHDTLHCFVLMAAAQPACVHDESGGGRATDARFAVDEQSAAF